MRVSTDFKTHRFFKYNIYIRTTNLKHSLQQNLTHTQMHTGAHTYYISHVCCHYPDENRTFSTCHTSPSCSFPVMVELIKNAHKVCDS